ncbi:hypothetical protein WJX64_04940 [Leifsonia sp. YIM 134122]|uniref:Holin n=1 Tax=Leifsonia stereocauli TaxID=3134136 RepID=A0ABU9W1L7_9MICO
MTNNNSSNGRTGVSRVFTETKAAFKTTEFWVFVVVSVAILIAAAVTDNGEDGQGFGAAQAWSYVALVSVGYMISRGLAKAGTKGRERDND